MAADTITLNRADVFEAAAWLLAFTEALEGAEGYSPPIFGDDWTVVAHGLADTLAGVTLGDLDEDEADSHPQLVELFARSRELAAGLVAKAAARAEDDDDQYPFTDNGSPWTKKGLGLLADELATAATETRAQGTIHPRKADRV